MGSGPSSPTPPAPQIEALAVTVAAIPGDPNALAVQVSGGGPTTVEVVCSGADEDHRWSATSAATVHGVRLAGLLADTEYRCVATADGERVEGTARTPALPEGFPAWTVSGRTDGYTLFNHWTLGETWTTQRLFIVDPEGRVRWMADGPEGVWPDIDASLVDEQTVLVAGGGGFPPTMLDLSGEQVWQAAGPALPGEYHHDTRMLPGGDVLALCSAQNTDGADSWSGFAVERIDPADGSVVWRWDSQSAVDAGTLAVPPPDVQDPWHANAITLDGDDLWVSLAAVGHILRIDVGSGEITGVLGQGGDWALVDASGAPLGDDAWFFFQHDPELDGRRVLIHDNRGAVGADAKFSRVMELELDDDAGTARLLWTWTEPGWFEPIFGDADRVGAERVRVTKGHSSTVASEPERWSSIVEVAPDSGDVLWRLDFTSHLDGVYRSDWLDGCAVFPTNTRLCP
jgi:hypothetical protein